MACAADPKELAEERRLAYVGITRAQKWLYLSRAQMRSSFGQPSANPAFRFLAEVPDDLVEWRRVAPERSASLGRRPTATGRGDWKVPERKLAPAMHLEVGDRVNHNRCGERNVSGVRTRSKPAHVPLGGVPGDGSRATRAAASG